jgi:MFS family permease
MSESPPLPSSTPAAPPHGTPAPKTLETFDKSYANRVMIVLMGVVMTVMYIEGMLTPSLYTIQQDFGVDTAQVTLLISVYAVSGVALSPVIGKLADIHGKRKLLASVMLCYAAAVSVTGFSPNFEFMVASRTIQGIGLTMMPVGMSLVREEFPRELVPRAQALLSAMFGVGFAVSLPLGAWVSQTFGWRFTYHSAIPVVVVLSVAVIYFVKESSYRRPDVRVDYVGAALLGGALAGIVTSLAQGQAWGWSSPLTLGFGVAGLLLFVPFGLYEVWWKNKGREPIVDRKLLEQRNVLVTNAVLTVVGMAMYLALFSLIYQFEWPPAAGGYNSSFPTISIFDAGLYIVPLAASMTVFAVVVSLLVSRIGVKPLAVLGSVVTAAGFYFVSLATTLDQALLVEIVMGAGIALLNASIINLLILTVDPRDMGQATAMNNVFRNIGGSVGAPIAGSLLATYVLRTGPFAAFGLGTHQDFEYAFWIASAITLVGALFILFAEEVLGPRRHPKFAHLPQLRHKGRRSAAPTGGGGAPVPPRVPAH